MCSLLVKGLEYWCLKVNRGAVTLTSVYCIGVAVTTIALIVPRRGLVMQLQPLTFIYSSLIFQNLVVLVLDIIEVRVSTTVVLLHQ